MLYVILKDNYDDNFTRYMSEGDTVYLEVYYDDNNYFDSNNLKKNNRLSITDKYKLINILNNKKIEYIFDFSNSHVDLSNKNRNNFKYIIVDEGLNITKKTFDFGNFLLKYNENLKLVYKLTNKKLDPRYINPNSFLYNPQLSTDDIYKKIEEKKYKLYNDYSKKILEKINLEELKDKSPIAIDSAKQDFMLQKRHNYNIVNLYKYTENIDFSNKKLTLHDIETIKLKYFNNNDIFIFVCDVIRSDIFNYYNFTEEQKKEYNNKMTEYYENMEESHKKLISHVEIFKDLYYNLNDIFNLEIDHQNLRNAFDKANTIEEKLKLKEQLYNKLPETHPLKQLQYQVIEALVPYLNSEN